MFHKNATDVTVQMYKADIYGVFYRHFFCECILWNRSQCFLDIFKEMFSLSLYEYANGNVH